MTVTPREDTRTDGPVQVSSEAHVEPPRGRIARVEFFVPLLALTLAAVVLAVALDRATLWSVARFAAIYLLPGGIDLAVPAAVTLLGLAPWQVLLLTIYTDTWVTFFWIWNLDHLARFERIGRMADRSRARANRLWQRHHWLRFASGAGLAFFIFLPIPGTGSFTGIVGGKLIELRDAEIFVASVVGTGARVAGLAFGFDALF